MMITLFEFLHMRAGSQGRSNEIKNVAFLLMLIAVAAPVRMPCHASAE
jgi:heme/copper-type cytochrome/quinol oxidase subunit 4